MGFFNIFAVKNLLSSGNDFDINIKIVPSKVQALQSVKNSNDIHEGKIYLFSQTEKNIHDQEEKTKKVEKENHPEEVELKLK